MHLIGIYAGTYSCSLSPSHRFALCLAAHSVEVIEYVEEYRHTAAFSPKLFYLIHRGHIQRFENGTSAESAVAGVCYYDTFFVVRSLIKSRTECYCCRSADDGVVREYTERNKECVHRAAETAIEARSSCEDFGKRAVEEEVDCKILYIAFDFFFAFDNGKD